MIAFSGIDFGSTTVDGQFDEDLEEGGSLPYCQIINPQVGLTSAQIKKMKVPYGLFVSKEQAELVNFKPSTLWPETKVEINVNDETIELDGYLCQSPIFLVLRRSQLEVQERGENGWRYIGLGYNRGQKTQYGQMVEDDTSNPPNYRYAVRYLLMFLSETGEQLHDEPLALTGKGGFGGSFGKEVSSYLSEIEQAYCRANKARGRFSDYAQAFVIHQHSIGFFKGEGKMAFACVDGRLAPVLDDAKAGQSKEVARQDRKVEMTGAPLNQLLVPKTVPLGQAISQLFSEHESFSLPGRGIGDSSESQQSQDFEGVGVIENPDFQTNGNAKAMFIYESESGDKQQSILISPSLAHVFDVAGKYSIQGPVQGGVVIVQSAELVASDAIPVGAGSVAESAELF